MKAWTQAHLAWVKSAVRFDQAAQEATLLDYIHEVDHVAARIGRLEAAIDAAVQTAPARMRAVIEALQALRGIALGHGRHDRRGGRRALALCQAPTADGIQRGRCERAFERRADPARRHHESGQRPSPSRHRRSRLGLSTPTGGGRRPAEAPGDRQCRGERDRLEGAAPVARPVPSTHRREGNANSK